MKQQTRTLRIIGGNWRSRKVSFADEQTIRPTGDRIRETLFNWLMHEVAGSTCLDLFAGSGILSLEALSRGAVHATMVDSSTAATRTIKENLIHLGAKESTWHIATTTAADWLAACRSTYDLVFLDPPFSNDSLMQTCAELSARGIARRWVYLESAAPIEESALPADWELYRKKSTGGVHYGLVKRQRMHAVESCQVASV